MLINHDIDAQDLQVANLDGLTQLVPGGYIKLSGWGIQYNGMFWVMPKTVGFNVKIDSPVSFSSKKVASWGLSKGLLSGTNWMNIDDNLIIPQGAVRKSCVPA